MNRIDAYQIEDNHQFKKLDFKIKALKKNRPRTKEAALADEVYNYFSKEISFPRIMKLIQTKGAQFIYETLTHVRKSEAVKNPPALFLHLTSKVEVELKEI